MRVFVFMPYLYSSFLLYRSDYHLIRVCMLMAVVPGIQISSGVVPEISTWDKSVEKLSISSSTGSASEAATQGISNSIIIIIIISSSSIIISIIIISSIIILIISSSSLPGHHSRGPRTDSHFSDLVDSQMIPWCRTWWGGWRRWPGKARWGKKVKTSCCRLLVAYFLPTRRGMFFWLGC